MAVAKPGQFTVCYGELYGDRKGIIDHLEKFASLAACRHIRVFFPGGDGDGQDRRNRRSGCGCGGSGGVFAKWVIMI